MCKYAPSAHANVSLWWINDCMRLNLKSKPHCWCVCPCAVPWLDGGESDPSFCCVELLADRLSLLRWRDPWALWWRWLCLGIRTPTDRVLCPGKEKRGVIYLYYTLMVIVMLLSQFVIVNLGNQGRLLEFWILWLFSISVLNIRSTFCTFLKP